MNFFTNFLFIVTMVAMFDGEWGPQPQFWKNITYVSNLIAIYSKGFFNWFFLLILPLCSIYRHGGHDGWSAGSSDITFKGKPLRMIQAKLGLNWPSGFRGEDFFKSLQMDTGELKIAG